MNRQAMVFIVPAHSIGEHLLGYPFSAIRIFIYNIVIYFMVRTYDYVESRTNFLNKVHLDRSLGFWTFHLFAILASGDSRVFQNVWAAMQQLRHPQRMSIIFVSHIAQYSGYMISCFK